MTGRQFISLRLDSTIVAEFIDETFHVNKRKQQ